MENFHVTNLSLSVFLRLLFSTLVLLDLLADAKTIDISFNQGECHPHYLGYGDTTYIQHRFTTWDSYVCELALQTDEGHHFQYFIDDANILLCDVVITIFNGNTTTGFENLGFFNCSTKILLPIHGRSRNNQMTLVIRKYNFGMTDFAFNMTVVANKGSQVVLDSKNLLKKEYDICNPDTLVYTPAMIYLPVPNYSTELYVKLEEVKVILPKCVFVVKTCAQCQVGVEVLDPKFDFNHCRGKDGRFAHRESSGCPFFTFYDGDYKAQTIKSIKSSQDLRNYSSETRHLYIETSKSFGTASRIENFSNVTARFRVYSKSKFKLISTTNVRALFFLTSPFFPDPCIQNGETYTYVVENPLPGYIFITFDDWLMPHDAELRLSRNSVILRGSDRRQSYYSTLQREEIQFYTGTYRTPGSYYAYLGFKATISMNNDGLSIPTMDCDKMTNDMWGDLKMNPYKLDGSHRDCIWLVKKPVYAQGLQLTATHLGQKDPWFQLEIHEGIVSEGPIKYKIEPYSRHTNGSVLLSTKGKGFYIRMRGKIFRTDSLVFHYAAFKYGCASFDKKSFLCNNARCIDVALRCDGVNHCEDNSDESKEECSTDATDNIAIDNPVGVGIIIPLVVSLVVFIFFCLFLMGLRRCYRLRLQRQPTREAEEPVFSDQQQRQRRVRSHSLQMSVTVTSGELPPSYNEVMRSAPLSNVNVAFSFCPEDIDPPSYGEAVQAENFDLSRSNSREDGAQSSVGNDAYSNSTAETTFSNFSPLLPAYTSSAPVHTSNSNLPSTNRESTEGFVFSVSNTRPPVTSFDPDEYVSSSSSAECYDYDEDDERRNFYTYATYQSDTSTDDDEDEDGNDLFTHAFNIHSGNLHVNNEEMSVSNDNESDNTKKKIETKSREEDGKGRVEAGENDECMESGRANNTNIDQDMSDRRYSYLDRRQRRVRRNERSRNVREEREGPIGAQRSWIRNNNNGSPPNNLPNRRDAFTDERVQRCIGISGENERISTSLPIQANRDRAEGQSQGRQNDGSTSRRYSWIARNDPRNQERNGAELRNSQGHESTSSLPTPLAVANYMVSPEDGESNSLSRRVPLAQVLYKMTDEDASASFV